jgi:hypothetical protein
MWPDEAYNQRPKLRWYEWFRQKVGRVKSRV